MNQEQEIFKLLNQLKAVELIEELHTRISSFYSPLLNKKEKEVLKNKIVQYWLVNISSIKNQIEKIKHEHPILYQSSVLLSKNLKVKMQEIAIDFDIAYLILALMTSPKKFFEIKDKNIRIQTLTEGFLAQVILINEQCNVLLS